MTDKERIDWLQKERRGIDQHYDEDAQRTMWSVEETWDMRICKPTIRKAIDSHKKWCDKMGKSF